MYLAICGMRRHISIKLIKIAHYPVQDDIFKVVGSQVKITDNIFKCQGQCKMYIAQKFETCNALYAQVQSKLERFQMLSKFTIPAEGYQIN